MKKLLLIDGNSILNRAFFGIRPLTNASGLYTHAVYGMMNIILKHLDGIKPDYAAVAFDLKAPTFRHLRYDGYKANRHGMPEELAVQLPYAKEAMEGMGLTRLELAGYEADDILGTCAAFGENDPDLSVYVLTGDRDSLQLIRDNVTVVLASTGEDKLFDREKFKEKYTVSPEQFVDVKALMGDSSDNIPGVPGIGEKTAVKLIFEHGSLDGVYRDIDGITPPSAQKKLAEGKESAYLSQFLSRIKCDVPLGIGIDDLSYRGIDGSKLKPLLTELELYSMIKRLGLDSVTAAPLTADETPAACEAENGKDIITVKDLTEAEFVALDVRDCALAFSEKDGKYSVSVYDGETEYRTEAAADQISAFLADHGKKVTVRDAKALCLAFGKPKCEIFDVTLAAYVCDPTDNNYSPDRLSLRYLSKAVGDGYDEPKLLYELAPALSDKLSETKQTELYKNIELPLSFVLAAMEKTGFKVDAAGLSAYSEELRTMCDEYTEAIYFEAGHEFNINSTKQLGEVLFGELKLPVLKKTKTGYSTDAETLEKLRPYHTIIDRILEYRQVAKLRSTYTEGLINVADGDGRIHSSFNQTVTATGRLSSSEPNLQNIPVRSELGRRLRKYFIPKNEDYVLIDADYSQIELRVLAAISGDERMIRAFLDGEDIHTLTASQVFGVPPEAVTPEQRKRAKAVNFGIIYGIGAFSLANDIGVSKYEADTYIKNYLAKYPEVSGYLNATVADAKRDGFVTTIFGRRRAIPELASPKKMMQAFGERVAMNSPIQGAAADIIKIAMINVSKALAEANIDAKLILQVHDELILEAHHSCAKQAADILKREMENAVSLAVPLIAEVGIGDNWLEC